ncbi:MAG: acetate--CoA ligase family protein, partial [Eubacteriales bacterium]|nr:acetate--CoA ligase family protein [Eubacteriales bacterium]
ASELLSSHGISMIGNKVCSVLEDVEKTIAGMDFPLVMKVLSPDIQHKTDAGCVYLNIKNIEEAKEKFGLILQNAKKYDSQAQIDGVLIQEMAEKGLEIIVGMKRDPQFGPIIMAGMGGIYVEVFKDISFRLLPLSRYDADEMIKETKLYQIIKGARGISYDFEELKNTILQVSHLVEKNEHIEEIDINPFFLYEAGKGGKGVDALIKLS